MSSLDIQIANATAILEKQFRAIDEVYLLVNEPPIFAFHYNADESGGLYSMIKNRVVFTERYLSHFRFNTDLNLIEGIWDGALRCYINLEGTEVFKGAMITRKFKNIYQIETYPEETLKKMLIKDGPAHLPKNEIFLFQLPDRAKLPVSFGSNDFKSNMIASEIESIEEVGGTLDIYMLDGSVRYFDTDKLSFFKAE